MGKKGKLSDHHTHKDGTRGWDIYIKDRDGHGKTVDKMHVEDRTGNKGNQAVEKTMEDIAESIGKNYDEARRR